MRFGRFEAAGRKPLSKSGTNDVLIDSTNEGRVVSVLKEKDPGLYKKREENDEKKSPRTLKGTFYLTKLAHLLRPQQVPDIHQAGETVDGQQTIDRDLHQLVKLKRSEAAEADVKLKQIGLGPAIDPKVNNYTKDQEGNVSYLDAFIPWQTNSSARTLELHFDKETLAQAIEELPDAVLRKECEDYLERLSALFEEEKAEFNALEHERLVTQEATIKSIEAAFDSFDAEHDFELLFGLKTEEEALSSPERAAAMKELRRIDLLMKSLSSHYITSEKYTELYDKYKKISKATGSIHRGQVDHTR
jgi:hypothetical protein